MKYPPDQKLVPYAGDHQWWTLEPDSRNAGKPSGPRDAIGPVWQERNRSDHFLSDQST
jgi:hypothetical protein